MSFGPAGPVNGGLSDGGYSPVLTEGYYEQNQYSQDGAMANATSAPNRHSESWTSAPNRTNVGGNSKTFTGTQMHSKVGHAGIDPATGQAPRRCTDLMCVFVFLLYGLLCLTLVFNAHRHGDIGRLTHGVDYYGRTCGVSAGVENEPFLYWCRSPAYATGVPAAIDLVAPSCVPYCPAGNSSAFPTGSEVQIPCLQPNTHAVKEVAHAQFGNTRTMVFQMQESIVLTAPYATTPRGGRFCVPKDPVLRELVLNNNHALGPFSHLRFMVTLGTLGHLYWLLAIACFLSCVLGLGYVYLIKTCPGMIAYGFVAPVAVIFILAALVYSFAFLPLIKVDALHGISETYMKLNPMYRQWPIVWGSVLSLITAVFLWLVSMCLVGMVLNFEGNKGNDLIHVSMECVKDVPGMYWIPVVEALFKFLVFWLGLQGFRMIASEGWIEKNRIHVNGADFAGLSRKFNPSTSDWRFWAMAILWCLGCRWTMECVQAGAQFMISWCVFKWWSVEKVGSKKDKAPSGTVCEAFKNLILYHFGSVAMGALAIPMYRPWRFLFWVTSEIDPDTPPKNCFAKCVRGIFCCCLSVVGSVKETAKETVYSSDCASKDGFNDVAIRSNEYGESVAKADALLSHSHKIIQYLYRDLNRMTLCVVGVCSISCITSAAVYLIVVNLGMYKEATSSTYINDPYLVTVLTWILSSYVSFGFMMLWDQTSDCLMYCYCHHRRWARKTVDKYCPDTLRFIVGFDDTEQDRYPYYGRAKNNMYLRFWLPMIGMDAGKHKDGHAHAGARNKEASSPAREIGTQQGTRVNDGQGTYMRAGDQETGDYVH